MEKREISKMKDFFINVKKSRILKKVRCIHIVLKKSFSPKIVLKNKSILINSSVWDSFDIEDFGNSQYDFVKFNKDLKIDENSLCNVVACMGYIDKRYLRKMPNLRWHQLSSHGFNGFDDKSIYSSQNVTVTNMKSVFDVAMAEYCITAYYLFHCFAFRKQLDSRVSVGLMPALKNDIKVMIIGIGNIGQQIAKMCKSQGWTVYGIKRNVSEIIPEYADGIVSWENSLEHIETSDYIISVLPETKETVGIYNLDFFKKMKPTAIFCNVGRGTSVVDEHLEQAVEQGIITGAVLDACNQYNYKNPQIIRTYHSSTVSQTSNSRMRDFFKTQLKIFLEKDEKHLDNKIELK